MKQFGHVAGEGLRYFCASALALALDFGSYSGLIRLAGVHYLVAAPIGFALGLALVYFLSTRWVFRQRRLADRRAEFALFALIGLAGMALNQGIIYVAVKMMPGWYEIAKLVSAAAVFCFNFACRKLLLFTRFG
ncbi:MAG TPA: GtrA family protein [Burkholderiales bacterium]|nr:GtrA family protein [Burkholderiales bacterium]